MDLLFYYIFIYPLFFLAAAFSDYIYIATIVLAILGIIFLVLFRKDKQTGARFTVDRFKNLPSAFIIFSGIGLGVVVALASIVAMALFNQKPPSRLPTSTIKAETIVGIQTGSNFEADPIILAKDGKTYTYVNNRYYSADKSHPKTRSKACEPQYTDNIEKFAGKTVSCQEVQPVGEWCPAPYTVVANTFEGDIWILQEHRPCGFGGLMFSVIFGFFGLIFSLLLISVKNSYLQADKRKE
ncbi:MAG: hypothetical protein Q4G39_02735 [Brachymonas sp.]|nr:hypothetical protein [Brachymonas sp.]